MHSLDFLLFQNLRYAQQLAGNLQEKHPRNFRSPSTEFRRTGSGIRLRCTAPPPTCTFPASFLSTNTFFAALKSHEGMRFITACPRTRQKRASDSATAKTTNLWKEKEAECRAGVQHQQRRGRRGRGEERVEVDAHGSAHLHVQGGATSVEWMRWQRIRKVGGGGGEAHL